MDVIHWDEAKRASNLAKHGLDFIDAALVLSSPYRLDIDQMRQDEWRTQSFAYVFDMLAVLTVVHHTRNGGLRIISFRPASLEERSIYHGWLENDFDVTG
ncbi:BrnT family toxin [Castellaniella sp.]|uniref:BrnT family toxin n=1 Tax=Castellaniella sp. TaxID=1955812 RepID=UPI002AFE16D1|nr:BrnT family toxin [Castellaniella sp.]